MPKGIRGSRAPHGTIARYNGHGCRCDECRAAMTEYYRKREGRRTATEVRAEQFRDHGASAYKKRGCRCDVCRAHMAEVKRRYRAAHPDYNDRQNEARRNRAA